jgi:hypothetical protein
MMEAARTSETSVDIQLRTRQYIPADSELNKIMLSISSELSIANLTFTTHRGIKFTNPGYQQELFTGRHLRELNRFLFAFCFRFGALLIKSEAPFCRLLSLKFQFAFMSFCDTCEYSVVEKETSLFVERR